MLDKLKLWWQGKPGNPRYYGHCGCVLLRPRVGRHLGNLPGPTDSGRSFAGQAHSGPHPRGPNHFCAEFLL